MVTKKPRLCGAFFWEETQITFESMVLIVPARCLLPRDLRVEVDRGRE